MGARIVGMLLVGLMSQTSARAAEYPIRDAAIRAVSRLASQTPVPVARHDQHPVLIGVIIGAGAGAVLGAVSTSCSAAPGAIDPAAACGTHPWVLGALVGGVVGSGIGALTGVIVKAVRD